MPTIAEIYEENDTRRAAHRVVIAGVEELPGVQEFDVQFAPAKVPTATVRIPHPAPDKAVFFSDIYIDAGFNGVTQRAFTGKIWNVRDDAGGTVLKCVGKSWPLDTDYRKVVVTLDSTTSAAAVAALLDELGITDYKIDLTAWTIGTVVPQTLKFKTYGEAIMHIVEVGGGKWWETPTGTVLVTEWDEIPGGDAARSYFSMELTGLVEAYPTGSGISSGRPRIRRARQEEQVENVKNRVFVRGAAVTTVDSDGVENTADIEREASAPSMWVLHADGSQSYNDLLFSNELIDVAAKAESEAVRLVTLRNRLEVLGSVVIDGDPRMQLAETIQVEDPAYSGMSGNWFVESYSLVLTPTAFVSELELRGGDDIGSTVNLSPIPLFDYKVEREVIGDRVWAVVSFRSESYDRDGTIVVYSWTDNQGPPLVASALPLFSIRVDPSTLVTPWIVTLTVTDNDGAATSLDRTVDIDAGNEDVFVPVIYTAFDTAFSCTPDGGTTWNDQAHGGGGVISVACWPNATPGRACFGTDDGQIYLTDDFCATALDQRILIIGGDNAIVDIIWDWRNPALVWAVTQDGRLYLSQDSGTTWNRYTDLREQLDLPGLRVNHMGLPGEGGVWVYGGNGAGIPVIAFLRNVGGQEWGLVALGGDLLNDVIGTLTADLYIADAADRGSGLAIILNSATFTPSVYFNDDPHGDGSNWTRATGLPAKSEGRWIDYDLEDDRFAFQYDDNVVYLGDVNFGVDPAVMAAAAAGATLDVGDEPNHGMAMTIAFGDPFSGAYLVSGEGAAAGTLYKTWDRFTTVAKLRPAAGFPASPAGANAKMSAIGRRVLDDERVLAIGPAAGVPNETALLGITSAWTSPDAVGAGLNTAPRIYPLTDQLWFAVDGTGSAQVASGPGRRTKDGGATWGATPDPRPAGNGIVQFALDAGGRVWCVVFHSTIDNAYVYWSNDEGDSWNLSRVIEVGLVDAVWKIMPHPTDQNTIAIISYSTVPSRGSITYTRDRGTTWAVNTDTETYRGSTTLLYDAVLLSNNRIVAIGPLNAGGGASPSRVLYSDNWGASWTPVFSVAGANVRFSNLFTSPDGIRLGFVYVEDRTASPGDWHLVLSTDGGDSFAAVALSAELETLWTTDFDAAGFLSTMSPERDALYCILGKGAVKKAFKLTPVSAAGVWTDITSDLSQALAYAYKGMAVIPRAS